jgi:hypothetical protein
MPEKKRKPNFAEDYQEGMFRVITDPRERLKLLARRFPELAEKYGPALEEAARHAEEEKRQAEEDQEDEEHSAEG